MSQARFQKMQREKARRAKAAAKRERRAERVAQEAEAQAEAGPDDEQVPPEDQVLADLEALHQRFNDDAISFEDFEIAKDELMQKLRVD